MTTYQISTVFIVEADSEDAALDTFAEAVADGSADISVTEVPDEA